MLNLFGCSNWDFFIQFFKLNSEQAVRQTVPSLWFSVGLFTVGQPAKENNKE